MRRFMRPWAALALAAITALAIAACGGSSSSSGSSGGGYSGSSGSGQTINLVEGTFPQSLDPGEDYTSQGSEVNWVVYTGLVTYAHASGQAGTRLIPGLATALPTISDGGRTYTAMLRRGLKFSNGAPVKASDFLRAVERAIKIPWGGSGAFITPIIVGGSAYSTGKAKAISGITADNATGKITIQLVRPYGPFDNVLAFPALGLVPSRTPLAVQTTDPPPGDGPYMVKNVTPGSSFDVVANPHWKPIPGIPSAKVNVDVDASFNTTANALAVLNNTADVFDWADSVPGSLLAEIKAKASDRFRNVNLGGATYYVFMNTQEKPFSSFLVRKAVEVGLDQTAMNKLGAGTLRPGCYFLAPSIIGHPTAPCPYGTPGSGNLTEAKKLVRESGMAGTPVTVWSQQRAPRQAWMRYYARFLRQLGFDTKIRKVTDTNYFTTIGSLKLHAQTGFADWNQDFPSPVDFYLLLDGKSILPTDNQNFGLVNDPRINNAVARLETVPTPRLDTVAAQWSALDEYVAKKAYAGVFGYQTFPFFMSDRMKYAAAIHHPLYGWDFTTFQLK
jgi:peptide/nickel transport system substrate-binding protein